MKIFVHAVWAAALAMGLSPPAYATVDFNQPTRLASLEQAVTFQQEGKFEESFQEFHELMRLGSARASIQLALMTLNEEGTDYDPVRAWAYFEYAGELGANQGYGLAEEVFEQLSVAQQQAGTNTLALLRQNALITERRRRQYRVHEIEKAAQDLTPLGTRRKPRYPKHLLNQGQVGYIVARILVNTDGRIAMSESLFSSARSFETAAHNAISRWRYEPIPKPIKTLVMLEFMVHATDAREPYVTIIKEHSWPQALAGSPGYQAAQAAYLDVIVPSGTSEFVQDDLYSEQPPTLADFAKLDDDSITDRSWPVNWTATYWYHMAAQTGEPNSQQILAETHDEWAQYLIEKGDPRAAAWAAVRWLGQDDYPELYAKGLDVIERLKDSNNPVARDVAATLIQHYAGSQGIQAER